MNKAKTWFKGLSRLGKIGVVSVAAFLGMSAIGALAEPAPPVDPEPQTSVVQQNELPKSDEKTTGTIQKKTAVAYKTVYKNDSSITKGKTKLQQSGINGERTITYKVTYVDGEEIDREEISREVTKDPVTKVVLRGTKVALPKKSPSCDPNYSGCVPIASDVDCGGGSGNGPAYQYGAVKVLGYDIYDLDRDGDGLACE